MLCFEVWYTLPSLCFEVWNMPSNRKPLQWKDLIYFSTRKDQSLALAVVQCLESLLLYPVSSFV